MPAIQRMYHEFKSQGLEVLAVNATNQDSVGNAVDFAHQLGLSFPILLDNSGNVGRTYMINAFPTTFFLDEEGEIQEVIIGGPMSEALLKVRILQLLGITR
jgi:peroxiredoxin